MRKLNVLFVLVILCGVWTLNFAAAQALGAAEPAVPGTTAALQSAQEPVRVVCLGDSVTGVYYHTGGRRAYTDMLAIALKRLYPNALIEAFNAGISGNTTVDALKRLEPEVLARKPQLVTVMFGLNDMTRVPLEEFEANLSSIVRQCRGVGAEVMLCTPNSVTDTPDRPVAKLVEYVAAIRNTGQREQVPVVDCYAAFEAVRAEDPFAWLMLMSDEIHPNMSGHKLIAETIAAAVSGGAVSLEEVGPPEPLLPKTLGLLKEGKPIRIHAMPPFDGLVASLLPSVLPGAQVEVTLWQVQGMTLPQIMESAKAVRDLKPDLVIVAVPAEAGAETKEEFLRCYKWVLNYALSFGCQEWDCFAVVPSVGNPDLAGAARERNELARILVRAQDIGIVERAPGDARPPEALFTDWLKEQLAPAAEPVLDVGGRAQLFIDKKFLDESSNIMPRVNPPVKAGPCCFPTGHGNRVISASV